MKGLVAIALLLAGCAEPDAPTAYRQAQELIGGRPLRNLSQAELAQAERLAAQARALDPALHEATFTLAALYVARGAYEDVPVERFTVHHLVPRARGGNHGPTARFCSTCHRQVHAMFSETTLAEELYSVELLRANHRVAAFLTWMRKQRTATFRVRRARDRN